MTMSATEYYTSHRDEFLDGLKEFLRIPSVSLPEHKGDIARAAAFVADELKAAGLRNTVLIEGEGNPIVSAEWMEAPGKPTVLIYGHYDVQPADPLNEWASPPFEPQVRGDDIFARGASDDKGQTYLLLKAVEGLLQADGELPVNVKFLIEGEEETGGEVLEQYLRVRGRELGADAALVCDTEMFAPELPTLCVGLRGLVYTEIEVEGPRTDLHSGVYGGVAPNALQAISEIIAGLKEPGGKVAIGDKRREGKRIVEDTLNLIDYPEGYGWSYGFWTKREDQEDKDFVFNILLALFMVYFVMAALFESLTHPLAIMFSLPFAVLGIVAFLMLTGSPYNWMARTGSLVLVGIVVNNGIVLIDHINNLRRKGMPRFEAIQKGCRERFRPIVMTASTTVVSLIPLAFGSGGMLGMRYFPMARTLIGGMLASTILTLIVLPTYYSLFDDMAVWAKQTWRATKPTPKRRPEGAAAGD